MPNLVTTFDECITDIYSSRVDSDEMKDNLFELLGYLLDNKIKGKPHPASLDICRALISLDVNNGEKQLIKKFLLSGRDKVVEVI